jgi:hypothetical protein
MKSFTELRVINVSKHIEKKGNLSYLSWTWAVDTLLQEDPTAYWEFHEPKAFGETLMVFCTVHAMGKSMTMHLPVMDNKNQAVKNPDARKVSDTMMRCLAKCIACFGIGLYIYAGEDIPRETAKEDEPIDQGAMLDAIMVAPNVEELRKYYVACVKQAGGNQELLTLLEAAKDARKMQLTEAS